MLDRPGSQLYLSPAPPAMSTHHSSNSTIVGWVPEPNGRGTISLVITCMATLALCVWSATHLNVAMRNESYWQYTLRYAKWSLVGIFGPELVVWTAWRQYISARALSRDLEALRIEAARNNPKRKTSNASTCSREEFHWTMTHGFYAGMGGFVIEMDSDTAQAGPQFIPDCTRLTLTARGVTLLAKCGLLPEISKGEIEDKSKTDGLAKTLACLQASWMVVQVLARLKLDLAITLLEVNTLGHVICAFVIYLLWWNKPRWIQEPTKLEGPWVRPLAAYMYMSSHMSGDGEERTGPLRDFFVRPELSALAYCPPDCDVRPENTSCGTDDGTTLPQVIESPDAQKDTISEVQDADLTLESTVNHNGSFMPKAATVILDKSKNSDVEATATEIQQPDATSMQAVRWDLAAEAVNLYPQIRSRFTHQLSANGRKNADALRFYPEMPNNFKRRETNLSEAKTGWLEPSVEQLVTVQAGNWPADDLLRGMAGLMMGMTLWLASIGFGAVHIAAWKGYFPSEFEAWLWRSSSIYISFAGLLWLAINILAQCSRTIWWYWFDVLTFDVHWINYALLGSICSVCGVAYVFARGFLVVEAVISLRSLPAAAYKTPSWTMSIPHL